MDGSVLICFRVISAHPMWYINGLFFLLILEVALSSPLWINAEVMLMKSTYKLMKREPCMSTNNPVWFYTVSFFILKAKQHNCVCCNIVFHYRGEKLKHKY